MIFKVGNEILDTNTTPIGLVFKSKDEAKVLATLLSSIIDGDTQYPVDGNGDWWFMCPGEMTKEEKDLWSILTDEQKTLLVETPEITLTLTEQF